jgi:glycosyltransferase
VYGDLNYVQRDDISKVVRHWKSHGFSPKKLRQGWMPPHPTFYVKRKIYEKYGGFDTSFKIAADYDSILRFLGQHQISTAYVPEVLVQMRLGGVSNRDLRSILKKSGEDYRALKKNGIGGKRVVFMKNFSKVSQFVKREKHKVRA